MKTAIVSSRTSLLCLVALVCSLVSHNGQAAQISSYPRASFAATNDEMLLNVWTSPGVFQTKRIALQDLFGVESSVTGTNTSTNFVFYSTNIFFPDSVVSNYFATNVFANSYLSNWFQTNSQVSQVFSNFFGTNLFLTDPYVSNWFATNLPGAYLSNYFATNLITTTLVVSNYYTTAKLMSLYYLRVTNEVDHTFGTFLNDWSGPTNLADTVETDWRFTMTGPVSITNNASSYSATGLRRPWVLTLTNSTANDYPVFLPAWWWTDDKQHSYWVSNKTMGIVSMSYYGISPSISNIMAVFRRFDR